MIAPKVKSCWNQGQIPEVGHSLLTGREHRVIIQGQSSSWAKVTSGVPQGTALGLLLFLIY